MIAIILIKSIYKEAEVEWFNLLGDQGFKPYYHLDSGHVSGGA